MAAESTHPFTRALSDALREAAHPAVGKDGNINWSTFGRDLPTIHYETLRKILAGDRGLSKQTIEEIAAAAKVDPSYFAEYRLITARELFDPRIVGFHEALANLTEQLARDGAARKARRPA